ncbi:MAG: alanine racemase [Proteobacteria bacterium]|nr:alanine racemase [Pseudomonadota bacterium]
MTKHAFEEPVFNPSRIRQAMRPTRAEIDLGALRHNLETLRSLLAGPPISGSRAAAQRAAIWAVVKADAYGHGLVRVAHCLARHRVAGFGVALAEEGFRLRRAGIRQPILILNAVYGDAHAEVLAADLTPVVFDLDQVAAFASAAQGRPVGVHLKVDTGMSRLGVPLPELEGFLTALERWPSVRLVGLMTHLACADSDHEATLAQLAGFRETSKLLRRFGHQPELKHVANSAGALWYPEARFDVVRIGLALYGLCPPFAPSTDQTPRSGADPRELNPSLKPAMRVCTQVACVKELPPGTAVGYDRTYIAPRRVRVAIVPMGYGDGLMWSASNRGHMLVRGSRCPIVGRISMDLACLDVSQVRECGVGDEAVLIGRQGEEVLTANDLAQAARTIPYEILTGVSPRVPRVYSDCPHVVRTPA